MAESGQAAESRAATRDAFEVGVVQTSIARPDRPDRWLPTEIWYPALPAAHDRPRASHPLGLPHDAIVGLLPIAGPRPLIVFSHGNSGFRQQSTFLMTHLARAGFVVAAPDHVGNTFPEMVALPDEEARRAVHREIRRERPADVHAVIRALLDRPASQRPELPLPALEATRVGVIGHSFGGWTALKLPALDSRVQVVCTLAPASEAFVGRGAFSPGELPLPEDVKTLVIAARDDVLVDLETSLLPLFARLGPNAELEILDDADHFHFCDGIELLHRLHESHPREGQRKPTRPYRELRGEGETQKLLASTVLGFFSRHLSRGPAT